MSEDKDIVEESKDVALEAVNEASNLADKASEKVSSFFSSLFSGVGDEVDKHYARRYKLESFDVDLHNGIQAYLGDLNEDVKFMEVDEEEDMAKVKGWVIKHLGEKDSTALSLVIDKAGLELSKAVGDDDVRTTILIYRIVQLLDKEEWFKNGKSPKDFLQA